MFLKSSRSSARRMESIFVPSSCTLYFSRMPFSSSSIARLRPVCPPREASRLSGRSRAMIFSSEPTVSGSIYTLSAMSVSVMMVAGLELTSTTSTPSSLRTRQACVPA